MTYENGLCNLKILFDFSMLNDLSVVVNHRVQTR